MAVLLITHDMGVIAGRTDRVVVMYAGKIAEEADHRRLFAGMRHPYSEALLASVPKIEQKHDERLLSIPGLPPDLSQTITNCRFSPRCQYATDQCRNEDPPLTDSTTARPCIATPVSTRSTTSTRPFRSRSARNEPAPQTAREVALAGGPTS